MNWRIALLSPGLTFLAVPVVQDLEALPVLDRQEADVADALLDRADDLQRTPDAVTHDRMENRNSHLKTILAPTCHSRMPHTLAHNRGIIETMVLTALRAPQRYAAATI